MSERASLLTVVLVLLACASCGHNPPTDTFCAQYTPVYTLERERLCVEPETNTTNQINNMRYACFCLNEKDLCP